MRVIAGILKSRVFRAPRGHRTHPMSERIRGALFSIMGDLNGLTVLDAFAGSGALAIEAISRGAKSVTAVEHDIKAYKTITENLEKLGIDNQVKATRANVSGWSDRVDTVFDIVLLDPPYNYLQAQVLQKLGKHVRTGGLLVLSWPVHEDPIDIPGHMRETHKNYGDASLYFYRKR